MNGTGTGTGTRAAAGSEEQVQSFKLKNEIKYDDTKIEKDHKYKYTQRENSNVSLKEDLDLVYFTGSVSGRETRINTFRPRLKTCPASLKVPVPLQQPGSGLSWSRVPLRVNSTRCPVSPFFGDDDSEQMKCSVSIKRLSL